MANEIGILVPLKYDWMEKTVELLQDGLEPSEIKQKLREYLSLRWKVQRISARPVRN